jgi:hypothetical protein
VRLEAFLSLLACIVLLVVLGIGIAHFYARAHDSAATLDASAHSP